MNDVDHSVYELSCVGARFSRDDAKSFHLLVIGGGELGCDVWFGSPFVFGSSDDFVINVGDV